MYTRDEVRELLETGTVRRTIVRSPKSEVKSQASKTPKVETLPRASRAVRVVRGRYHDRVDYLLVPDGVADDVIATGTTEELAGIEGVELSPYVPAGCVVVRTLQV